MSLADFEIKVEWLVACLSPGDIAPHPNFRTDRVDGPELLALVVNHQQREYGEFRASAEDDNVSNQTPDLPAIALRALSEGSVRDGFEELLAVADDSTVLFGKRAAAALLAGAVASELDVPERVMDVLERLCREVERGTSRPTGRLVAGVLRQQLAVRAFEAGEIAVANASSRRARDHVRDVPGPWDEFAVSRGIGWTSAESQAKLAVLIESNALALIVGTSDPLEESWADLVRSPFPEAATKSRRDTLAALEDAVGDEFKRAFGRHQRSITLGGGDTQGRLLYSAMLHAELTGELSYIARMRVLLGMALALRLREKSKDEAASLEALRLLRQGDAQEELTRFIRNVRRWGPLPALCKSAEDLISARAGRGNVTSTDLTLIRNAADMVSSHSSIDAVRLAMRYIHDNRDGRVKGSGVASWRKVEIGIGVVSDLVDGNDALDLPEIVTIVLEATNNLELARQQAAFSALARLTRVIDWARVPTELRSAWGESLTRVAVVGEALSIDVVRACLAVGLPIPAGFKLEGLEFVLSVMDKLDSGAAIGEFDRAVSILVEILNDARVDAASGRYSGFSWSPFQLAAYLATRGSSDNLWRALTASLRDPNILNEDKIEAMSILSDEAQVSELPEWVRGEILDESFVIRGTARSFFRSTPEKHVDHAFRTFRLAHDLLSPVDICGDVLRDLGSPDAVVRLEAARACMVSAMKRPDLEWPVIVLLQLSHDGDGDIREVAALGISFISVRPRRGLKNEIITRTRELLRDEGVAIVMGALRGLDRAGRALGPKVSLWCRDELEALRVRHESRVIRAAVRTVLDHYSG